MDSLFKQDFQDLYKDYKCQLCCRLVIVICSVFCRVWDVHTGEMLNTLIHHCEAVLHLRFCDGIMVTCSKVC